VSPWLASTLRLCVAPNGVSALHLQAAGWAMWRATASVEASTTVEIALDAIGTAPELAEAAKVVSQSLAQSGAKASRIEFVMDDRLVRYFVVKRAAGLRNTKELTQFIHSRFEDQFGDPADEWDFACDASVRAERWLACAVRKTHAQLCHHIAQAMQVKTSAILGAGAVSVSLAARRHRSVGLLHIAGETAILFVKQHGEWVAARRLTSATQPEGGLAQADFVAAARREMMLHDLPADLPLLVVSPRKLWNKPVAWYSQFRAVLPPQALRLEPVTA
jgi:hypothetical protein